MAAIGVFDVTKRAAVTCTSVRYNTCGPIVADSMPTKRTAFASVRYNTCGPIVADFMPTKRTALASVRSNTSRPIIRGLTRRTADAIVVNDTGKVIVGVSLLHKYSNVYKSERQWDVIQAGDYTRETLKVEYHTGFLTTGTDWWFVSWFSEDWKTLYYSDPNNFQGIIYALGNFAPEAIAAAAGAAAAVATSWSGPGAEVAATTAAVAARAVTSALFSSESTEGFKAHMLTAEDGDRQVKIILKTNGEITLQSPSGESDTGYSSKPAPTQ